MSDESFHKELDLIQGVITRMAQNSFLVKSWGISLVAIILALTQGKEFDGSNSIIVLILVGILIFSFWFLDAYFLRLERLYRKHYEWVIRNRDAERLHYDLNVGKYNKDVDSIYKIHVFHFITSVLCCAFCFSHRADYLSNWSALLLVGLITIS